MILSFPLVDGAKRHAEVCGAPYLMINYTIYVGSKRINRDFGCCINSLSEAGKALSTLNPKVFLSPSSNRKAAVYIEMRVLRSGACARGPVRLPGPTPAHPQRCGSHRGKCVQRGERRQCLGTRPSPPRSAPLRSGREGTCTPVRPEYIKPIKYTQSR